MSVIHINIVIFFFVHAQTSGQETQIGCSLQAGLQLHNITLKPKNLYINSFLNKVADLTTFMRNVRFDYFVVSQSK